MENKLIVSERAIAQLEAAKDLLKDTESGSDLVPTEDVLKSEVEYQSDVSPEAADRVFGETTDKFIEGLNRNAHLNPEAAEKIRKDYGLKNRRKGKGGRGKLWTVGINLSKKEK